MLHLYPTYVKQIRQDKAAADERKTSYAVVVAEPGKDEPRLLDVITASDPYNGFRDWAQEQQSKHTRKTKKLTFVEGETADGWSLPNLSDECVAANVSGSKVVSAFRYPPYETRYGVIVQAGYSLVHWGVYPLARGDKVVDPPCF